VVGCPGPVVHEGRGFTAEDAEAAEGEEGGLQARTPIRQAQGRLCAPRADACPSGTLKAPFGVLKGATNGMAGMGLLR